VPERYRTRLCCRAYLHASRRATCCLHLHAATPFTARHRSSTVSSLTQPLPATLPTPAYHLPAASPLPVPRLLPGRIPAGHTGPHCSHNALILLDFTCLAVRHLATVGSLSPPHRTSRSLAAARWVLLPLPHWLLQNIYPLTRCCHVLRELSRRASAGRHVRRIAERGADLQASTPPFYTVPCCAAYTLLPSAFMTITH